MFRTHGDTKGTKAHKSAKAHNSNPATEGRCEYNSKNSVASVPKHPASCSNRGSTHTLP